jgi:mono/diheme cytochrome c family protein
MKRALLLLALAACDEDVALREPDPSWNRMLEQPRADAYDPSTVFADGKAMREPPRGTIARDAIEARPEVTRALLDRGRGRFEIFCATCHGILGDGTSVVATKMELRPPPSLVEGKYVGYDPPHIEYVIDHGFGLMPSYADALAARDRWAVANYVKALQIARASRIDDLPPELRASLPKESP